MAAGTNLFSSLKRSAARPLPGLPAVLLVTLVLMLPAALHGGPFLFFDSEEYFQVGRIIVERVFGPDQAAAAIQAAQPALEAVIAGDVPPGETAHEGGIAAIAASRPPTYPLFLYLSSVFATIWATAALQALVCAVLVVRFLEWAWGKLTWPPLLTVALVLSIFSGLGFHAAFIMPDVFTGCLALTLTLYFIARPKSRWINVLLLGAAFIFATTHSTNILLLLSAIVAAVMVTIGERKPLSPELPRLGAIAGVAIAAMLATSAWTLVIRATSGDDPRSPPYLMARLIADGPGAAYLTEACTSDTAPFAACAFRGKPFPLSDSFLWSETSGGYGAASPELRRAVQIEEKAFVLAVLAAHPVEEGAAAFGNFATQLGRSGIGELNYGLPAFAEAGSSYRSAAILGVTPGAKLCLDGPAVCAEPGWTSTWDLTVRIFDFLVLPIFVGLAVWLATGGRRLLAAAGEQGTKVMRSGIFLSLLVLANAAVCAVLSGPFDRYHARIVWALALALSAVMPSLKAAMDLRRGAAPARQAAA